MVGNFLNLHDEEPAAETKIGAGLKRKGKKSHPRADTKAVAKAGQAHGFTRLTDSVAARNLPRRGRPPLNEDMAYWRIYVSPDLRDQLNELRDQEGRRLNDVLQDMLSAYQEAIGKP